MDKHTHTHTHYNVKPFSINMKELLSFPATPFYTCKFSSLICSVLLDRDGSRAHGSAWSLIIAWKFTHKTVFNGFPRGATKKCLPHHPEIVIWIPTITQENRLWKIGYAVWKERGIISLSHHRGLGARLLGLMQQLALCASEEVCVRRHPHWLVAVVW